MSIWWRKRPGKEERYNVSEWFTYPDDLDTIVAKIENSTHQDVCITTSLFSEDSRTPKYVTTTASVWMDSDTCEGDNYRIAPSWTVQTSAGRWQHHWDLLESVPTKLASEVSHKMAIAHQGQGADISSWPANKIMRVPGTSNTGYGPFPEVVVGENSGLIYAIDDLLGAYEDIDLSEVENAAIMGHIDAPTEVDDVDGLPDYGEALDLLPQKILDMALAEPDSGPNGYRSQLRWKLMARMFDEVPDLSFDQVLVIAWNAPASRKWSQEDPRGIHGLISEAAKIHAEVMERKGAFDYVQGETDTVDEFADLQIERKAKVKLLTSDERKKASKMRSWIDTYVEYSKARVAKQNAPYARMNAWTILSANFCDKAYIPRKNGPEAPNLYTMTLGETTTGKSQELKLLRIVMNECAGEDEGWDIGGNASENALAKHLIERDHKMSVFNKDEAHGLFKVWNTQDWSNGMMTILALLYDGYMPPMLRMGNADISGKSAHAYLVMHLMGTPDAMVREMTREMYTEGFLARFITAIGEPREITEDSMAEEDAHGEYTKEGFDPVARQFAKEFQDTKMKMYTKHGGGRYPVTITREAARRVGKAKWDLVNLSTDKDQNFDILNPSLVRMGVNIRKAATLLALTDGRDEVNIDDVILGIQAAEEWTDNLFDITSRISASEWQRACDEVEEFVLSKGEPVSKVSVIRRFRAIETKYLTSYLESLYAQGRLYEFKGTNGAWFIAKPGTGGNK